jgi:hypothetical protein
MSWTDGEPMKSSDMSRTRGGRVSRWGFRLAWLGLAMLPIGLVAQLAKPSTAIDWLLFALLMVFGLVGLAIALYGQRVDNRALAEYDRRVAAGEESPWKPGDPNPLG